MPPIIVQLLSNTATRQNYSLKSVHTIYSGAAPLGVETVEEVKKLYPKWIICQGYGMTTRSPPFLAKPTQHADTIPTTAGLTESSPGVTSSLEHDLFPGSAGSVLPAQTLKVIDADGKEVTAHDTPGELYIQGPNIVLGYLNNPKATAETFVHHADGRWLRTGDEVVVRNSPKGFEHLVIVDRIKELIKVKVRFLPFPRKLSARG